MISTGVEPWREQWTILCNT